MAKILPSDLMLLNRESVDGTRSIHSYNGIDFDETVQQVIDNNKLYDIYVNMTGDEMSGLLTIDVNKSLINPENLLCLDVLGRTNSKQLYLDPSNNDAAHISLYFEGDREHLVYYENHINIVDRQYIGNTDDIDDKTMLQMERDKVHLHSEFTLGVSAVIPTIRFELSGAATFDGKVLLVDTLDLEENHAAHRGYVDSTTDQVRSELLGYVQTPIVEDNFFNNVNFSDTVTLAEHRYTYSTGDVTGGIAKFNYVVPDELGTQQTNWESVESITLNKTTLTNDQIDTSIFSEGNEFTVTNVNLSTELHYGCATYTIDSVIDDDNSITVNLTHVFTSNETPGLDENGQPSIINGSTPHAIESESYMMSITRVVEVSSLDNGTFYWETIPNSVDGDGNPVEDWRIVNKLIFSTVDKDGNGVSTSTFRVGTTLEANSINAEGESVTASSYEILTSTAIQINQVDQAADANVFVDAIEVTLQYMESGDDLELRPGTYHNLRVLSTVPIQNYIEDENQRIDSRVDVNEAQISALQNDVLVLEQAFERGRLYYSSSSGAVSSGKFALNDESGAPINQLSNTSIKHIYLHKTDFQGGFKEWTPGTEDSDFNVLNKAILFVEVRDEIGVDGHGEFLIEDFEDAGEFVHFSVTFSSGSNNVNTSDSLYTVKIVSTNQGISSIDAYSSFVSKSGDNNMRGDFVISNDDSIPVLKLKNNGAIDLGSIASTNNGTLSFYGTRAIINKGVDTVLEFDNQVLLSNISFDMNENSIVGLPIADGSIGTQAANVEYVSNYVEKTIATETSTGGIKIRQPFSMDDDFLVIGVANVKASIDVVPDDMGVCAFNNATFEQNTVNGTKFITARTNPTYSNYGMVKISTPMMLTDGGHLTVKTTTLLSHTNANELTVRTASTSRDGVVKLIDSVTSTSTSLAATANSVKSAYDLAQSTYNALFTPGNSVAKTTSSGVSTGGFWWDGSSLYYKA